MNNPALDRIIADLQFIEKRHKFNRVDFFEPYNKQFEFFALGAYKRERLLIAGNQLGKTEAGGFETAVHMTGDYPSWWTGRRWDRPVKCWIAGETSTVTRDVQQKKLCGEPGVIEAFGTGMIPKVKFVDSPSLSRGVTDAYDTIQVRHKSGGVSIGKFKSFEQGRQKFQGDTLDFIWMDEEPPADIYSECLTRITATKGMVFTTFTPLKGRTWVVLHFMDERSDDRDRVTMTIMDAKHIPAEERARIIAGYPAHEREARVNGIPMLGEGRIFTYPEELIREPALQYVPAHWSKLWGIDFGIGHPFGAVLQLWDRDNDVLHIHHAIRIQAKPGEPGGMPMNHARAMIGIGANVPVAWPHDGEARDKGSGITLAAAYRKEKLIMLGTHATFVEGGYSTEAGVLEMQQRMETGRYKVASHLEDWWNEYRNYHRKDGQIVKIGDDLLSASRIALMDKRHSRVVSLGGRFTQRKPGDDVAEGLDFDVFAA